MNQPVYTPITNNRIRDPRDILCTHIYLDLRWVSCCPGWHGLALRPGSNRHFGCPAHSERSRGAGDSGCRAWWAGRRVDSRSRRSTRCAGAARCCNVRNCGNNQLRFAWARGRTRNLLPCYCRPHRICCDLERGSGSVWFLTEGLLAAQGQIARRFSTNKISRC